jgi:hypothetical protein
LFDDLQDNKKLDCLRASITPAMASESTQQVEQRLRAMWDSNCAFEGRDETWERLKTIYGSALGLTDVSGKPVQSDFDDLADICEFVRALNFSNLINLKNGEIVVNFQFPKKQKHSGDAYLRMIPRTEMDIAVVGCAVNVTIENDKCVDARVALGAVAPTALLVKDASKALIGSNFEKEAVEKAALACEAACNPIDDKRGTISYRKKSFKSIIQKSFRKSN